MNNDAPDISALCPDCQLEDDTPIHKIFFCSELNSMHREQLLEILGMENIFDYSLHFLFTNDENLRKTFKNQCKHICDESLGDDEYFGKMD